MSPDGPLKVILNPAASGGRGEKLRPGVERALKEWGLSYSISPTKGPGHAEALVLEARQEGAAALVVVGGDGTIHEIANGLLNSRIRDLPMAVVPVGTGNDFFHMLNPARDPEAALSVLRDGKVRAFDVGRVAFGGQARYFVNLLGLGLDVEVLRRRARFKRLSGLPQYLLAIVSALLSFRPEPLRARFPPDQQVQEGPAMLAGVTIGPSLAGGFLLSPRASPTDGLLDFFFIHRVGLRRAARLIPRVIRGTHEGLPEFHLEQVREVHLSRLDGGPFHFELDGELMPDPANLLEISILSGVLPVLVPRGFPSP